MRQRKQSSTAYPIAFYLALSSDHNSPATGLAPAVTIRKANGAWVSPAGAVSEVGGVGNGNGWYELAGHASDRDTLGELLLHATATGADPADVQMEIVSHDPFALPADKLGYGLADGAITAAKIGDGALTAAKFAAGAFAAVWAVAERTLSSYGTLAADVAAAVWGVAVLSLTAVGSIGKYIIDRLDVAISTRLAATGYVAPDNVGIAAAAASAAGAKEDTVAIKEILGNLPMPPTTGEIRLDLERDGGMLAGVAAVAGELDLLIVAGKFTAAALANAPAGGGTGGTGAVAWSFVVAATTGTRVAGALVEAYATAERDGAPVARALSDSTGTATLKLDPGTYWFWTWHADYTFTNPKQEAVS
jgi:hypothetical protein